MKETRSILTHKFTPDEVDQRPLTEDEVQEVRKQIASQINQSIQDWKKCGGLKNAKDISDGYHTFDELYETRAVLNIALFKQMHLHMRNAWFENNTTWEGFPNPVWRSNLHSDGSMFDGMFILGLGTDPGEQITFHYHLDKWDACDFAETLEKAPEFDGHTPAEALERIKAL